MSRWNGLVKGGGCFVEKPVGRSCRIFILKSVVVLVYMEVTFSMLDVIFNAKCHC